MELLGVLPVLVLVAAALWQLGLTGLTYVWTGYAAQSAARSVALGETYPDVRDAALGRLPSAMRSEATIDVASPRPDSVGVTVRVPAVLPGVMSTPWTMHVDRDVVREP